MCLAILLRNEIIISCDITRDHNQTIEKRVHKISWRQNNCKEFNVLAASSIKQKQKKRQCLISIQVTTGQFHITYS